MNEITGACLEALCELEEALSLYIHLISFYRKEHIVERKPFDCCKDSLSSKIVVFSM